MKKNILVHEVRAMSSLEIAELTGKRHDNVLRDIKATHFFSEYLRKLKSEYSHCLGASNDLGVKEVTFRVRTNFKTYQAIELNYRFTMIVISGYSEQLRTQVIDRWLELEQENRALHLERDKAKSLYPDMNKVLEAEYINEKGHKPNHHLYSNNANMINRIVIKMSSKAYKAKHSLNKTFQIRDNFTKVELELVSKLERFNTVLVELGDSYLIRKAKLTDKFGGG